MHKYRTDIIINYLGVFYSFAKGKYILDEDFAFITQFSKKANKDLNDLPVFMVIKNNQVYFLSKGYTIGIGKQMIKHIQRI